MFAKNNLHRKLLWGTALGIASYHGLKLLGRRSVQKTNNQFIYRLMVDKYPENLFEIVSASKKVGLQNIIETNLRSEKGQVIQRPLGSPKNFPNFEQLMFNFAQLHRLPTDEKTDIPTDVVIGPRAKKPLKLSMPIMISGMAYGLALSAKAKIALAKGSAMAGTSSNTGEGAFLAAERKAAQKLVMQYNRGAWNKSESVLRQADAIEIHIGQGAGGGTGHMIPDANLSWRLKRLMGIPWGKQAVIHATHPGFRQKDYLPQLVTYLRVLTDGVPVGIKMAGGKDLEKDLEIAVQSGIDYIALDGSEAGSKGTPPILQDDFGLPTLFALKRANDFLVDKKLKNEISLIVSGGFYNPGQMLKAIALGADAIYIGSVALFALVHTQVLKVLPWEPPASVVFFQGAFQKDLNIEQAAKSLAKFLNSCNEEIKEGIRAMGKQSLQQVNKDDLFALTPTIADILGISLGSRF